MQFRIWLLRVLLVFGIVGGYSLLANPTAAPAGLESAPINNIKHEASKLKVASWFKSVDKKRALVHLLCGVAARSVARVCHTKSVNLAWMTMACCCIYYGYCDEDKRLRLMSEGSEKQSLKPLARGWFKPVGQLVLEELGMEFVGACLLQPRNFLKFLQKWSKHDTSKLSFSQVCDACMNDCAETLSNTRCRLGYYGTGLAINGTQIFSDKYEDSLISLGRNFAGNGVPVKTHNS